MPIDTGSTAWLLVSMALVQLMTPGLALFYGGLVSEGSVLTIMIQSFVAMGLITILWYIFVFSLCFGETVGFFGNPGTYVGMRQVSSSSPLVRDGKVVVDGIPGLLFVAYQGMFAVITPALMTGTFADRFRFKPYLIFITLWLIVVYAPWCHWMWGGGFLAVWGCWDFAGGIVVHTTAGFSAVASLAVVGKRRVAGEEHGIPHNVPFVALGTAMLWFGWFGFNGGSALSSGGVAVAASINSQIAASVCMCLWLVTDWILKGRPGLVGLCIGAVAGLATITPVAGYVSIWAAFVIGIVACIVCYSSCELLKKIGLDDALDVWGCHGMGGFIGSILLGALADPPACGDILTAPPECVNPGTVTRSGTQFGKQIVAAVFCALYSVIVTVILLKLINLVIPIVPSEEHLDAHGSLDQFELGEQAYHTPTKKYDQSGNSPTQEYSAKQTETVTEPVAAGAGGVSQV